MYRDRRGKHEQSWLFLLFLAISARHHHHCPNGVGFQELCVDDRSSSDRGAYSSRCWMQLHQFHASPHFCDKFTYQLQLAGALCGSLKKIDLCALVPCLSVRLPFFDAPCLWLSRTAKSTATSRDVSAGSSMGMKRANDRFKRKSATRPQNSYRSN